MVESGLMKVSKIAAKVAMFEQIVVNIGDGEDDLEFGRTVHNPVQDFPTSTAAGIGHKARPAGIRGRQAYTAMTW